MKRGILVDAEMALPLLEAFCFPAPGDEPNIDRSMEIYSDILRSETLQAVSDLESATAAPPSPAGVSASPSPSPDDTKEMPDVEPSMEITVEEQLIPLGPTVEIYDTLLHGIARSTREVVDFPRAWKLLEDMKVRGIHFQNETVVGHIKRFMTRATSHKEAFEM